MLWKEGNTQKQFTIGPYPTISLKEAREKRDAVHGLLVQGLDPNEQYRAEQKQQDEETPLTSRVVAQEWYAKRTVTQTENTRRLKMQRLERHVFPSFGDLPIKRSSLGILFLPSMPSKVRDVGKWPGVWGKS